jgi:hypothetical protein
VQKGKEENPRRERFLRFLSVYGKKESQKKGNKISDDFRIHGFREKNSGMDRC